MSGSPPIAPGADFVENTGAGRRVRRLRLVAQRIEHQTSNLGVAGSSPAEATSPLPPVAVRTAMPAGRVI